MAVSLAEVSVRLPARELLRIQKHLKTILRAATPQKLRQTLFDAYGRLGRPSQVIESLQLGQAVDRLLKSFGVLDLRNEDEQIRAALERCPYTLFLDEHSCSLSVEAFESMMADPAMRCEDLLLARLLRLRSRERRQWAQWLDCYDPAACQRDQSLRIYRQIASLRRADPEDRPSSHFPEHLDQVFSDDPLNNPVAWFLRGILPLYQCLREAEVQARQTRNVDQLVLLGQLREGRLVVVEESEVFGRPPRYRLLQTREEVCLQSTSLAAATEQLTSASSNLAPVQESLFGV
ncbi:MAG: hypothetical protein K1X75_11590 [Leptospirales bacterium]|nr:hypothetical protein [Leptospirales bacterium]